MKTGLNQSMVKKVKRKWMRYAPRMWWGDNVDVRFYLASKLRDIRGKKILDAGCNAGIILSEIDSSNHKTGIDIEVKLLSIARSLNPGSRVEEMDTLALSFEDSSFDIVVLAHMLQEFHTTEEKRVLMKNVYRVLKPGGRVFITTPNRRYRRYSGVSRMLTFEELDGLLCQDFDYRIKGFNPFPPFPYFLPNAVMAKIPGVWGLLILLMDKGVLKKRGCSFFAEAVKK